MTVFDLVARLTLNSEEYKKNLNDAEKSTNSFASKLKSGLATAAKVAGAALATVSTAAAGAAVKLGKEVISAYADYEQLVGGVDTLFKESSGALQRYAANAYKTAGLSANDYMATVTSFSASLISSLGGDTEKAVSYADMAITDMADNANKMGTDISAIQTAYQGFAKQNYTMLDNLKLGYGGTKTEMERLISDAEALDGTFSATRDENGELAMSYADIVDAIHIVQTNMGITGTTAKEAEKTISGSISAMKSAIQNLVVGFGDANADVEMLTGNVISAFQNVEKNITPVIRNIITALPTVTTTLLNAVAGLLPQLLPTVANLFSQTLTTLIELLPSLIPVAVEAMMTIVNALIENLPLLVNSGITIILTLVNALTAALPTLIPAAIEAILTIVQGLIDNLPLLLDAALQLMIGLAMGLVQAIPVLLDRLPEIIESLIGFLIGAIPQIAEAGIELFMGLIAELPTIIASLIRNMPRIITGILEGLGSGLSKMWEFGSNLLKQLWEGIKSAKDWVIDKIKGIGQSILDGIKGIFGIHSPSKEMEFVGEMLVEGLADGIDENGNEALKAAEDLTDGVNSAFDNIGKDIDVPFATANTPSISPYDEDFTTAQGNAQIKRNGTQGRNLTVILELERQTLAKVIYELNNEETQRVGVKLANA